MMTATFADLLVLGACAPCKATGYYHFQPKDGAAVQTTRTCFRCGGKGYQTQADEARNRGYDRYAASLRPKAVA